MQWIDSSDVMMKTTQPLVSVVITTYNRPQPVRRAIQSVLAQTYSPLEVIVVEDGNDSGIEAWLQTQELDCVRYIRHEQNRGLAAARNTGLRHARGDYIAFLDDDDRWLATKLEKQVKLAQSCPDDVQVFYCGKLVHHTDGPPTCAIPYLRGDIFDALMDGWAPPPSTNMFRRQSLEQLGGYDEALLSCIDHDIWMQCARAGFKTDFVAEALVEINPDQIWERMTSDSSRRIKGVEIFLEKWEVEIERARGQVGFQRFRANYLSGEYRRFSTVAIQCGRYWAGIKNAGLALYYGPRSISNWTRFGVALTGSSRFYSFLAKTRRSLSGHL